MNPAPVGVAVAVLLGGAFASVGRGLSTTPRSLGAARARLAGSAGAGTPTWRGGVGWSTATGAHRRSGPALLDRWLGDGMSLAGLTTEAVAGRALTAALVVGAATLAALGALATVGSAPPLVMTLALAVGAPVMAGWTMVADARSTARRAHLDLRRAANDLIQLVAIGLTTDQSVEEAIAFALDTAGATPSPAADLLRDEITTAPLRGEPLWEAVERIGREHGVRELCEFAHSLERQATHGVSIGETVAALAAGMRARALDQLEREADRANANLAGPTAGFVVATLVFLAYPLALRISEAFGG